MFCQNCGNQIPDSSASCNFCGAPVTQSAPPDSPNNNKAVLITIIGALVAIIAVVVGIFVIKPALEKDDGDTTKKSKDTATTTTAAQITTEPESDIDEKALEAYGAFDDIMSTIYSADESALIDILTEGQGLSGDVYETFMFEIAYEIAYSYFDYEIIDYASAGNNTYEFTVSITTVDFFSVADTFAEALMSSEEDYSQYTDEELEAVVMDGMVSALEDYQHPTAEVETTISLTYKSGDWYIDIEALLDAFIYNYSEALDSI